ncbi:hypothetical protein ACFTY7_15295 [Streptomyces sp. NPDC057062]|uniref:hypothetical protein n=1 Tax=Streptomyces sp. NPDC057062 TaxID=3346011 RepID=UPI00362FB3B6
MNMPPAEPSGQDNPGPEPVSHCARRGLSRRAFVGGAAASAVTAAGLSPAGGLPSASATTAP